MEYKDLRRPSVLCTIDPVMARISFKLKFNGHIRRIAFQELPNWPDLAVKLQALYNIPLDTLGVSYIDDDNDEITVSSDEELQDFYKSSYRPGSEIRLSIVDLSIPREHSSPVSRNVGKELFDIVDPDWHSIPPISLVDIFPKCRVSEGPHAFVEIVNSNDSDAQSTALPYDDKEKRRESSFGAASVTSLVEEEADRKHPIHILDINSSNTVHLGSSPAEPKEPAISPVPVHTIPNQTNNVANFTESHNPHSSGLAETEDPPLPTFNSTSDQPNLYRDVASFLATFSQVLTSHPELSEGVRNIVNNASNGEYWRAHRASLSDAAREISQVSETEASRIEAEAARRIQSSLSNICDLFSPANMSHSPPEGRQNMQTSGPTDTPQTPGSILNSGYQFWNHWPRSSTWNWAPNWHAPPWLPHPPPPPPPPPPPRVPHPPPPPPGPLVSAVPASLPPLPPLTLPVFRIPPPPPPIPPFNRPREQENASLQTTTPGDVSRKGKSTPQSAISPETSQEHADISLPSEGHTEDLRTNLEQAKQAYKIAKEAYQQERERRRQKDTIVQRDDSDRMRQ